MYTEVDTTQTTLGLYEESRQVPTAQLVTEVCSVLFFCPATNLTLTLQLNLTLQLRPDLTPAVDGR